MARAIDQAGGIPVLILEGILDHRRVGVLALHSGAAIVGIGAEDAVRRIDLLLVERSEAQHLFAEFRPAAAIGRHFHGVVRRSNGLRSEAGVLHASNPEEMSSD